MRVSGRPNRGSDGGVGGSSGGGGGTFSGLTSEKTRADKGKYVQAGHKTSRQTCLLAKRIEFTVGMNSARLLWAPVVIVLVVIMGASGCICRNVRRLSLWCGPPIYQQLARSVVVHKWLVFAHGGRVWLSQWLLSLSLLLLVWICIESNRKFVGLQIARPGRARLTGQGGPNCY